MVLKWNRTIALSHYPGDVTNSFNRIVRWGASRNASFAWSVNQVEIKGVGPAMYCHPSMEKYKPALRTAPEYGAVQ